LVVDHLRERKTGPCFALTVMRCRVHRLAFTLYPPGHVPYGRLAVAPVAADGSEERMAGDEATRSLSRWQRTVMRAALDAAEGHAWPRCSRPEGDLGGWASQGRGLDFSERLLGVSSVLDESRRLRVASALGLPALVLREQAARMNGGGYRARGEAVVRVLGELERRGACVLAPLLRAGHEAGLWGAPLQWEAARRVLRPLAFPASGTRPP
jgi:hypothetical protein